MRHECKCGGTIPAGRWDIGFELCLECGEWVASQKKHTIVPMHKSNYTVVTNLEELKQINPKRIGE
jgi:hypothetical protein